MENYQGMYQIPMVHPYFYVWFLTLFFIGMSKDLAGSRFDKQNVGFLNWMKNEESTCLMGVGLPVGGSLVLFQSCSDDDDEVYVWYPYLSPNALVTVKGGTDSCFLQLDDETTLWPVNLSSSPFGEKEVRALVHFTDVDGEKHFCTRAVYVNWMDSILTKKTVPDSALVNDSLYGNDPVDIVDDWVTVAEDGYLTLRFSTLWGNRGIAHKVNLLTGGNPENPYEVEFRHDACGDAGSWRSDALVAFDLGKLPDTGGRTVKLTLVWQSFRGRRTAEFDYCTRKKTGNVARQIEQMQRGGMLR